MVRAAPPPARPGPRRLVDWPWVTVEVECALCHRCGRYRLARLAERLGAERDLGDLLHIVSARCTIPRWDDPVRQYEARCGVRYRVPAGGPLPADLPVREVRAGEPAMRPRPRRRREPDGPLPTIADTRRQGVTAVRLCCEGRMRVRDERAESVPCCHVAEMALDALGLPDDLPFIHIGRVRRFRCRRCGGRDVRVLPSWPDPREVRARLVANGAEPMVERNGIVVPRYGRPDPATPGPTPHR